MSPGLLEAALGESAWQQEGKGGAGKKDGKGSEAEPALIYPSCESMCVRKALGNAGTGAGDGREEQLLPGAPSTSSPQWEWGAPGLMGRAVSGWAEGRNCLGDKAGAATEGWG